MLKRFALFLSLAVIPLAACSPVTQTIPVSSNPSGATVYADGKQECITPCAVELETTQAHVLTLQKQGYNQADVQISQKYDTGAVTRAAVRSGMSSSSMGGSVEGSIANALFSAEGAEASGEAYVLTPSSVVVRMVPEGQTGTAALESQPQVQTTEPATMGSAIEENPEGVASEVLKEAGTAAVPSVGVSKTVGSSSHSSTKYGSNGSMTRTKTSSSAKVGVSVNPVEAGAEVLKLLEGAEGSKQGEAAQ